MNKRRTTPPSPTLSAEENVYWLHAVHSGRLTKLLHSLDTVTLEFHAVDATVPPKSTLILNVPLHAFLRLMLKNPTTPLNELFHIDASTFDYRRQWLHIQPSPAHWLGDDEPRLLRLVQHGARKRAEALQRQMESRKMNE